MSEGPNSRGGNISLCAAISPIRGMVSFKVKLGSFNSDEYVGFLRGMFNELAFQARSHIVVQDNVPFHKTAEVKAVFEEGRCHHQQEFVPAWSPQLNMIEECWSKVKAYVKRHEKRDQESLLKLVEDGLRTITREDAHGWYRHLTRIYIDCAAGIAL